MSDLDGVKKFKVYPLASGENPGGMESIALFAPDGTPYSPSGTTESVAKAPVPSFRPLGVLASTNDLPGPPTLGFALAGDREDVYFFAGKWFSGNEVYGSMFGQSRGLVEDLNAVDAPQEGDRAMISDGHEYDGSIFTAYPLYIYIEGAWVDTGYRGYYETEYANFIIGTPNQYGDAFVIESSGSLFIWESVPDTEYSTWTEYANWRAFLQASLGT